ncbi:kinase-like domain-containing protein [Mycena polygramma]|nr:kinase-like domain-containing protein [Mycena polygramma]
MPTDFSPLRKLLRRRTNMALPRSASVIAVEDHTAPSRSQSSSHASSQDDQLECSQSTEAHCHYPHPLLLQDGVPMFPPGIPGFGDADVRVRYLVPSSATTHDLSTQFTVNERDRILPYGSAASIAGLPHSPCSATVSHGHTNFTVGQGAPSPNPPQIETSSPHGLRAPVDTHASLKSQGSQEIFDARTSDITSSLVHRLRRGIIRELECLKPWPKSRTFPDQMVIDGVLLSIVEEGGFGTVFRYEACGLICAVKVKIRHSPSYIYDNEFITEGNILARIQANPHRNLLSGCQLPESLDEWFSTGIAIVSSSYYPESGPTIKPISGNDDQLKTILYSAVLGEIASGLNHLHSLGVIHMDLKPGNILIGYDGHCVIADFGACIDLMDPTLSRTSTSGVRSVPDILITTAGYTAPETLYRGLGGFVTFDTRADLWSLGMTMYAIVTTWYNRWSNLKGLTHAQPGLDGSSKMRANMRKMGCPLAIQDLTLKLCQIDPADRMPGDEIVPSTNALM